MRDLHSHLSKTLMLTPIVGNNTTEGTPSTALDLRGYGSAELIALIGVSADTLSGSVKIDVVLEDSSDNTTFAPVTEATYALGATPDGSGIIATVDDAAEDAVLVGVGYVGPQRYVRLRLVFTGTHTSGTPVAMVGLRGHAELSPAV